MRACIWPGACIELVGRGIYCYWRWFFWRQRHLVSGLKACDIMRRVLSSIKCSHLLCCHQVSTVIWRVLSSGECSHLACAVIRWVLSSGKCCHLVNAVIWWVLSSDECCHLVSAVIWWVLLSDECTGLMSVDWLKIVTVCLLLRLLFLTIYIYIYIYIILIYYNSGITVQSEDNVNEEGNKLAITCLDRRLGTVGNKIQNTLIPGS